MKKETKKEKNTKKKRNVFIYILFFITLILIYARYIEPNNLIIKEYKIENTLIPDSFEGIKIIHFSDIHYGRTVDKKYLKKIVNLINKQKPDIVIFTGDFLDKKIKPTEKDIKDIKNELNKIESTLGNYIVSGNHDMYFKDEFNKIFNENFIILNNEEKLIYFNDSTPISLVGLSDASKTKVNYEVLEKENNIFRIVLAHQPDEFNKIKDSNFNILLSGHSHNGQIRLPFIGTVYTPNGSKTYYENYYKLDNKEIFVSNGIGTSGISLRFGSTPSINLYRLYAY